MRTCFSVVIYAPTELFAFIVRTVKYTVLAATSGHPEVNWTSVALAMAPLGGTPDGSGASPKKYSIESSNPKNSPTGVMRPVALALNRPAGTAEAPSAMICAFAGNTVTGRQNQCRRLSCCSQNSGRTIVYFLDCGLVPNVPVWFGLAPFRLRLVTVRFRCGGEQSKCEDGNTQKSQHWDGGLS